MNIRITLPAVFALGLAGSGMAVGSLADGPTVQTTEIADVSLLTMEGEPVRLGDLLAKSTTVHFGCRNRLSIVFSHLLVIVAACSNR